MKFRHLVRFTRSRYFKVDYDEYQSAERSHHILDRKHTYRIYNLGMRI